MSPAGKYLKVESASSATGGCKICLQHDTVRDERQHRPVAILLVRS